MNKKARWDLNSKYSVTKRRDNNKLSPSAHGRAPFLTPPPGYFQQGPRFLHCVPLKIRQEVQDGWLVYSKPWVSKATLKYNVVSPRNGILTQPVRRHPICMSQVNDLVYPCHPLKKSQRTRANLLVCRVDLPCFCCLLPIKVFRCSTKAPRSSFLPATLSAFRFELIFAHANS